MDNDSIIERIVADAAPLQVRFVSRLSLKGRNATFTPADPVVQIRVSIRLTGVDRLATLAHILGHAEAQGAGRPEAYARAVTASAEKWRGRPADEQRAVLAEEVTAWQRGLTIALRHGLTDTEGFLRVARERLATMRGKLDVNIVAVDAALEQITASARPPRTPPASADRAVDVLADRVEESL